MCVSDLDELDLMDAPPCHALHSFDSTAFIYDGPDYDDFPLEAFASTNVRDGHSRDLTDDPSGERPVTHGDGIDLIEALILSAVSDVTACPPVFKEGPVPSAGLTYTRKILMSEWRTNRDEARTWLLDEHDPKGHRAFSFDWCCSILGRNNEEARERISLLLTCPLPVEAAA